MDLKSVDNFKAVAADPAILLRLLSHLTCRDALHLCMSSKDIMQTVRAELQVPSDASSAVHPVLANLCCPRIIVVASGAKKLLEIPITHSGSLYDNERKLSRVSGRAPSKRKRINKRGLPGAAGWLTGIAVNPSDGHLYVCDYGARGIVRYDPNNLSRQHKYASVAALSCPEGIAFVSGTCYIACVARNNVAALDPNGKIKQTLSLPEGLVPWGMTAWQADQYSCARIHTGSSLNGGSGCSSLTSSNAALFIAVDVEYITQHYTLPPETATGGVLCVPLSSSSALMGPAYTYSKVTMKRPSGLTFDNQGHLWVTSAQQQLLLLAGPTHSTPGVLLQTLDLPSVLPHSAKHFYPFDVHAIVKQESALAAAAGVGAKANIRDGRCREAEKTLLVVTLHYGSRELGAVAILEVSGAQMNLVQEHGRTAEVAISQGDIQVLKLCQSRGLRAVATVESQHRTTTATIAGIQGFESTSTSGQRRVRLLHCVSGHPALREPNMVTVLT